ncbi:MAG: arsenate reductase [Gemmatimonadota bacterium]|nr:arsenate reductase [Gemmatimonadota bacterium]
MPVQIFGVKKSQETRRAQRFFSERRVQIHFVDLKVKAASYGELKRFADKFGVAALVDRESKRFLDLGLKHSHLSDERWLEKLVDEPTILRMPLVRWQKHVTIGVDEPKWKEWMEQGID